MLPEVETVIAALDDRWAEAKSVLKDIDKEALTYRPGDGFNSISAIAAHIAGSAKWWIGEVVAGRDMHRDRDSEFRFTSSDADALAQRLDDAADLVREVVETLTSDVLDQKRECRGRQLSVRAILLRVLSHIALHVGHMQVTRQLWETQQASKKEAAAK